jgi:hypothetical protein
LVEWSRYETPHWTGSKRCVGSSAVRVKPIASENFPSLRTSISVLSLAMTKTFCAAKWPITKPVSLFWGFFLPLVGVFV